MNNVSSLSMSHSSYTKDFVDLISLYLARNLDLVNKSAYTQFAIGTLVYLNARQTLPFNNCCMSLSRPFIQMISDDLFVQSNIKS